MGQRRFRGLFKANFGGFFAILYNERGAPLPSKASAKELHSLSPSLFFLDPTHKVVSAL